MSAPLNRKYSYEELRKAERMLKGVLLAVFLAVGAAYCFHLYQNYLGIMARLRMSEAVRPIAFDDDQTVMQTGTIKYVNRDWHLRDKYLSIMWTVQTSPRQKWICTYDRGFSRFEQGDTVRLVKHSNDDDSAAYLVGVHGAISGTVAEVEAIDEDDLMMDVDE